MRTHSPAYRYESVFGEEPSVSERLSSISTRLRQPLKPRPHTVEIDDEPAIDLPSDEKMSACRPSRQEVSVAIIGDEEMFRRTRDRAPTDGSLRLAKFASASELLASFEGDAKNDIVFLDWRKLGSAGADILRELDAATARIPVAMFLGGNEHGDIQAGFSDQLRLVADVLAARRDETAKDAAPVPPTPGHLGLDTKTCQAYWKGRSIDLTITEFNIVSLFARRIGENLSYREIYDVVHGPGFHAGDGANGYQTNVRSLIKRIRRKFHDVEPEFRDIENHRGYGYRWRAPARPVDGCDATTGEEREISRHLSGRVTPHAAVLTGAALTLVLIVYLNVSGG